LLLACWMLVGNPVGLLTSGGGWIILLLMLWAARILAMTRACRGRCSEGHACPHERHPFPRKHDGSRLTCSLDDGPTTDHAIDSPPPPTSWSDSYRTATAGS